MTVEERLTKIPTTPAINLLQDPELLKLYSDRYLSFCNMLYNVRGSVNLVQHCKNRLGKQDYCWVGEYKNWIWEFKDDTPNRPDFFVRVFVNNTQGVSIEFSPDTSSIDVFNGLGFVFGQLIK